MPYILVPRAATGRATNAAKQGIVRGKF